MYKILLPLVAAGMLILPQSLPAQEHMPDQCHHIKILGTHTVVGTYIDYFEEDGGDVTSTIYMKVKGKDFHINAFSNDVEKYLSGAKGKKVSITYNTVYGWIGDGCDEFDLFKEAKILQ